MNQVKVTIADKDYTLLTEGDPAFTQKIAAHVDQQLSQLMAPGKLSLGDAAVLAALNITEEYFQEVESAENLRRQLKEYLDESTKLKLELSEAKRELFKQKGGK